jgi:carboxymethylenebutenolidase
MTALIQLGLMPEYLTFPYPLPGGQNPSPGRRFEYQVPGAGKETAEKMRDKNAVSSNQMCSYKIREVDE